MSNYSLANSIAILQGSRNPSWTQQIEGVGVSEMSGAPDASNSGVYLENAIEGLIFILLRETAHRRTARVKIGVLNLTAVYTVTIGGNAASYDAAVDDNGAASASAATVVVIAGVAEANYTINISATGGGSLTCEADSTGCNVRLWSTHRGTKRHTSSTAPEVPSTWAQINGGLYTSLDYRGFNERITVAGLDRLYAEVSSVVGAGDGGSVTHKVRGYIGPCIEEG